MIERLRGYWPIRLAGAKSFARVAPEAILVSTLAVQKSLGKEASFAQAERTVDAVIEGIKIGVKKTKSVQLIGFGTFKNCHTQGAHGRQSKDREKIKARKMVKFVPESIQRNLVIRRSRGGSGRGAAAGRGLLQIPADGESKRGGC